MKTLSFNNQQFQADRIIKSADNIIGQDINGNEVFAFRGISDFTLFKLEKSQDFDIPQPSIQDLQKQIFDLTSQLINGGAL